jgi:hypothetical protein
MMKHQKCDDPQQPSGGTAHLPRRQRAGGAHHGCRAEGNAVDDVDKELPLCTFGPRKPLLLTTASQWWPAVGQSPRLLFVILQRDHYALRIGHGLWSGLRLVFPVGRQIGGGDS